MTSTATATRPVRKSAIAEYNDRLAGMPEERFFGSVAWYTVAGTRTVGSGKGRRVVPVRVHYETLREWFADLSIPEIHMPPAIKKIDAFRNASSSTTREYDMPPELGELRFAKLHIEEIKSDSDQVIRHVMRTIRDEKREQLSMDHMATIKFIRGGRTAKGKRHSGDHIKSMVLTRVRGVERDEVQELINEFSDRYDDLSSHLHAPALRGVVRSLLLSYNAIQLKPSLYFVHKSRWDQVDQLAELLRRVGDGCSLEEVPLIDSEGKRATVKAALETEVEDDCNKLLSQIAELNATGNTVKPTKYAEINAAYQEVAARVEEYADMLMLSQGRAADALELALQSVLGLSQRIDTGGRR